MTNKGDVSLYLIILFFLTKSCLKPNIAADERSVRSHRHAEYSQTKVHLNIHQCGQNDLK